MIADNIVGWSNFEIITEIISVAGGLVLRGSQVSFI
jgi:hypothetical protein